MAYGTCIEYYRFCIISLRDYWHAEPSRGRETQMRSGGVGQGERPARLKPALFVAVVLAITLLASASTAGAEVVRDFTFQLKDPKASGAYTVTFSERSSDTSGAAVPPLTRYSLRFPLGMSIRREVLKKRVLCDGEKLKSEKDRSVCKRAQIGGGKAEAELLDANDNRLLDEPVPANLYFFLGRSTKKGAVASMLILVVPDASAPIVNNNPSIRNARLVGEAPFFNDPTPDGLFGYRLELPPALGGLRYNAFKGDYSFPGLTITKRVRKCVSSRAGKCRRKRFGTKKIFWITTPKCPASGKLAFQASYTYTTLPQMTLTREISCPKLGK
jgi:hypothetical protein